MSGLSSSSINSYNFFSRLFLNSMILAHLFDELMEALPIRHDPRLHVLHDAMLHKEPVELHVLGLRVHEVVVLFLALEVRSLEDLMQ